MNDDNSSEEQKGHEQNPYLENETSDIPNSIDGEGYLPIPQKGEEILTADSKSDFDYLSATAPLLLEKEIIKESHTYESEACNPSTGYDNRQDQSPEISSLEQAYQIVNNEPVSSSFHPAGEYEMNLKSNSIFVADEKHDEKLDEKE